MQTVYLALAVLTSGYSGAAYRRLSLCSGSRATSFLMPLLWYVPLATVFGGLSLFSGPDAGKTVLLPALLAGAAYALCAFSLLESMKANAYSLTVIITNLSFIFPVVLSVLFLQERAHWLQVVGMLLAVAVILLINQNKEGGKSSAKDILLAVSSSLCNGVVSFAIKLYQHNAPQAETYSFNFFAYLFGALFSLALFLLFRLRGERAAIVGQYRRELLRNAPAVAICNGVCYFSMGLLAGMMNAAAQFTVITSLSIVVSLVIGYWQMHKRVSKRDVLSVLICAIAIACQYFNLS